MAERRMLIAGNWKMNGLASQIAEAEAVADTWRAPKSEVLICPPATLVGALASALGGSAVAVGGQDCHAEPSGAHTGDISAQMLKDSGARFCLTGHSERRTDHGESDADVQAKSHAAQAAGLIAVICIGETLDEREGEKTLDVIRAQLAGSVPDTATAANTVIAYEPVWAIGTGLVPTIAQISEAHDFMRAELVARFGAQANDMRLLYGGSVKPANAAEIFAVENVDGALVGGASLKAADFNGIIAAAEG
ncbi:Triosephosphate isomerase [Aquimixticola soesokkakensis]|uniref:Triosephosphate isomerase n=1 Tax=Aquimixticola soesokkakensis TaxID=1519096 RepID=A0A1Y5SMJ3_9RHOB|nr:triose-phosphate isomerase [Aquimixticola soesokkakensis]SLN44212.1 Triosephosphate isomerase [Aquimixticola soesokkakensis]